MQAWQKKKGKWGTLALTYLVYAVFGGICGGLATFFIGEIVWFVLAGAFTLGLTMQSLKVIRDDKPTVNDIFSGFKNFGNAFLANLINNILIFLWSLLLIVPGIIKAYSYSMTFYIMSDDPQISANDARKKSMEMMRGNKWRLFCLQFSFIGWWLLSLLTLSILALWVAPYSQAATAAFYQSLLPPAPEKHSDAPADDGASPDPFDNGVRL